MSFAVADSYDSVSNITDDASSRSISLAANAVPWSEVASSYNIDFGKAVPIPQVNRLRRGLRESTQIAGHGLRNKRHDHTLKDISFNISAGQQDQRRNIYTDHK